MTTYSGIKFKVFYIMIELYMKATTLQFPLSATVKFPLSATVTGLSKENILLLLPQVPTIEPSVCPRE